MLFCPNKFKHKKHQKGSLPNKNSNNILLQQRFNNSIKLVSTSYGTLTSKHLTTIKFLLKKKTKKKKSLIKFKIFPQKSITKKPLEIRMGKGKGAFSHWAATVKKGTIICEIFLKLKFYRSIKRALKLVKIRLPIKTIIIE